MDPTIRAEFDRIIYPTQHVFDDRARQLSLQIVAQLQRRTHAQSSNLANANVTLCQNPPLPSVSMAANHITENRSNLNQPTRSLAQSSQGSSGIRQNNRTVSQNIRRKNDQVDPRQVHRQIKEEPIESEEAVNVEQAREWNLDNIKEEYEEQTLPCVDGFNQSSGTVANPNESSLVNEDLGHPSTSFQTGTGTVGVQQPVAPKGQTHSNRQTICRSTRSKRKVNYSVSNEELDSAAVPASAPSTSRKRPRTQQPTRSGHHKIVCLRSKPCKRKKKGNAEKTITMKKVIKKETGEGVYKVKVISLKCTEADCQVTTPTKNDLLKHLKSAHDLKPYQCIVTGCGARFRHKVLLGYHYTGKHTDIDRWHCSQCRKKFNTQSNLSIHMYHQHELGQFECGSPGCHFTANTRYLVNTHQNSAHRSKRFLCKFHGCGKTFKEDIQLATHERIHLKAKAFRCVWTGCSYSAVKRENMVKHIRTTHFKLPSTLKEMKLSGIVEDRNPADYYEVDQELLNRRL